MPLIGTRAAASAQGFSFTQIASAVDRLFEYVSLLLTGNGTNGAQNNTFLDSSSNNFTVTRNGNTTQGSFSPFGDTWSNYFDGTGDYLSVPDNAAFYLATGDFTVEAWVYKQTTGRQIIVSQTQNISAPYNGWLFYISTSNKLTFEGTNGSAITATPDFPTNQWVHVAAVRSSSTTTIYQNGVSVISGTVSITNFSTVLTIGQYSTPISGSEWNGYISNVRILKGTALYTANFIPPTSPLTAITNTSLLTCQSNRFIDNSTNNFAITVNGNTSVQKFSPFLPNGNTWSNYFDGAGDFLVPPLNTALDPGTGNFTFECWFYASAAVGNSSIFEGTNSGLSITFNAGKLAIAQSNVAYLITDANNFPTNQWAHIAAVRSGTTLSLYLNGSRVGTATNSTNFVSSTQNRIGRDATVSTPNYITGYLSNLRIVKGTAVYDPTQTTLTVPTAPLTAISGTSLLTCQNSTIRDNSPNKFPITVNGNVAPNTLSPFLGFSGYFDGTGDSLTVADNAALEFGSGDFTIECYFNSLSVSGTSVIFCKHDQSTGAWIIYRNGATIQFYLSSTGTTWDICNGVTVGTITANTWAHVAISRSGSSIRSFLNGVLGNTTTSSSSVYDGTQAVAFGANVSASGDYFAGYISNARIVKGTAVYTAAFTPPAVPVLPITNTSLLLNFANAGIQDVAMINDIETVGNAQVSTTQSKFGGGSLSFDGAGDWILTQNNPALNVGGGNFTLELWVNFSASVSSTGYCLVTKAPSSFTPQASYTFWRNTSNKLRFVFSTDGGATNIATIDTTNNFTPTTGQWYHLAVTRVGSTFYIFIDGVSQALTSTYSGSATSSSAIFNSTTPVYVGAFSDGTYAYNGYIDELRITNGIARYVSNFNPPPAPFKTY